MNWSDPGASLTRISCLPAVPLITVAETPAFAALMASRMASGVAPLAMVSALVLLGVPDPALVSSVMVRVPPLISVPPTPEKGVAAVEVAMRCGLASWVTSRL